MKDVPSHGRDTQGVRVMRLKPGEHVAATAVIAEEEEGIESEQ